LHGIRLHLLLGLRDKTMKLKPGDKVYWPLNPKYTGLVIRYRGRLWVEGRYALINGPSSPAYHKLKGWKLREVERGGDYAP